MLLLMDTSDVLRLVTTSAADIDCVFSYVDSDSTGLTAPSGGLQPTAIASATTTTIVSSPGASRTRNIKEGSILNRHATTSCDVTVEWYSGSTAYRLKKVTLAAGEQLLYIEGQGWIHKNSSLSISTPSSLVTVDLGSQVDIASTTAAKVTAFDLALSTGVYYYQYLLIYQSAATTTGVKFSVNYTGTTTRHVNFQRWSDVSATASTAVPDQDNIGAAGHVMGCFASRANSTAGRGVTLSVDTANADMFMIIEGLLVSGGAGDLQLYHGAEVAATTSLMVGSSLVIIGPM